MLSQAPRSLWSLGAQTSPPPFSGTEGGSSHPCGFSSRAHSGLVGPTRKWNANPGLFKEREGLEARLGPGQAGCLRPALAPLCTWFDLLEGRERLQLQTENYLKPLPDVVSELGFYNLLTG